MDLRRQLLILLLSATSLSAQTGSIFVDENHNGHKIFGLPTPVAADEAATKAYADSHGGGGGGSVSLTATSPIIVTPSPITGTGVISLLGTTYGQGFLSLTDAPDARSYIGALSSAAIDNTAFSSSWAGFSTVAPSKKAVYDQLHLFDTDDDGLVNKLDIIGTGLVKTNAQVVSLAASGTDYAPATSGTSILYGDGSGGFSNVTVGSGLTFTTGTLTATGGGGTVTTTGSPATGNLTKFSGSTSITNGDLTGNVTTSGTLATTIANSAVTYAKIQNVSANSVLLGSSATGSGAAPSEIALGTNLSMTGSTLNAAGGGGGNVNNTGTPANNQVAIWTNATTIEGDTGLIYTGTGTSALLGIGGTDLGLARNTTGVLEINNGTAGQFGGLKIGTRDAGTNTTPDGLTISHVMASGTPAANFGESIAFNLDSTTTPNTPAGRLGVAWSTPTHVSRNAYMSGFLEQAGSGSPVEVLRLWGNGGLCLGTGLVTTDPGGSAVNCAGILINNASAAQGRFMQSTAGTTFVTSNYKLPTAAGTAGYTFRSDGTDVASFPAQLINSSTTSQSPTTSDVYLAGSNIVVTAGDFKVKGQYKCVFDMTKSAGTGAIVITLRVGTAGTTSDAAIQTYTFGAGTSVADTGIFEVIATWRSVGSGTSAVMQGICRGTHLLATTGLFNNAAGWVLIGSPSPSSGFNSSTATNIGLSFNGATAFAGTTQVVQAQLQQ